MLQLLPSFIAALRPGRITSQNLGSLAKEIGVLDSILLLAETVVCGYGSVLQGEDERSSEDDAIRSRVSRDGSHSDRVFPVVLGLERANRTVDRPESFFWCPWRALFAHVVEHATLPDCCCECETY
jgi:hypothetical protein